MKKELVREYNLFMHEYGLGLKYCNLKLYLIRFSIRYFYGNTTEYYFTEYINIYFKKKYFTIQLLDK